MKNIYFFVVFVLSTFFAQGQQNTTPTLSTGLDNVTFKKGTLNVELIAKIISEKQQELVREGIKRMIFEVIGTSHLDDYSQFYIERITEILFQEKNHKVMTKRLLEESTNYLFVLGTTKLILESKNEDLKSLFTKGEKIKNLDSKKDSVNIKLSELDKKIGDIDVNTRNQVIKTVLTICSEIPIITELGLLNDFNYYEHYKVYNKSFIKELIDDFDTLSKNENVINKLDEIFHDNEVRTHLSNIDSILKNTKKVIKTTSNSSEENRGILNDFEENIKTIKNDIFKLEQNILKNRIDLNRGNQLIADNEDLIKVFNRNNLKDKTKAINLRNSEIIDSQNELKKIIKKDSTDLKKLESNLVKKKKDLKYLKYALKERDTSSNEGDKLNIEIINLTKRISEIVGFESNISKKALVEIIKKGVLSKENVVKYNKFIQIRDFIEKILSENSIIKDILNKTGINFNQKNKPFKKVLKEYKNNLNINAKNLLFDSITKEKAPYYAYLLNNTNKIINNIRTIYDNYESINLSSINKTIGEISRLGIKTDFTGIEKNYIFKEKQPTGAISSSTIVNNTQNNNNENNIYQLIQPAKKIKNEELYNSLMLQLFFDDKIILKDNIIKYKELGDDTIKIKQQIDLKKLETYLKNNKNFLYIPEFENQLIEDVIKYTQNSNAFFEAYDDTPNKKKEVIGSNHGKFDEKKKYTQQQQQDFKNFIKQSKSSLVNSYDDFKTKIDNLDINKNYIKVRNFYKLIELYNRKKNNKTKEFAALIKNINDKKSLKKNKYLISFLDDKKVGQIDTNLNAGQLLQKIKTYYNDSIQKLPLLTKEKDLKDLSDENSKLKNNLTSFSQKLIAFTSNQATDNSLFYIIRDYIRDDLKLKFSKELTEKEKETIKKLTSFFFDRNLDKKLNGLEVINFFDKEFISELVLLKPKFENPKQISKLISTIEFSINNLIINKSSNYDNIFNEIGDVNKLTNFLRFIGNIRELNKAETFAFLLKTMNNYEYLFTNINDDKKLIPDLINSLREYAIIDLKNNLIEIDVASVLSHMLEKYQKDRDFSFYATVGLNQYWIPNYKSSNSNTSYGSFNAASEKIGVKYKIWNFNNNFLDEDKLIHKVKKKSLVSDIYAMGYVTGILYKIANTSGENYNYANIGVATGLTFFNSLDFNVSVSIPFAKKPFENYVVGFSFDIPLSEYLKRLKL